MYPLPSSPQWYHLAKLFYTINNHDIDIDTFHPHNLDQPTFPCTALCVFSSTRFYHMCRFIYSWPQSRHRTTPSPQASPMWPSFFFFFNFFSTFFYLFLGQRETEHERGRGRERGRHRIGNRLQALSHQPRARCGARTPGPRDRDLAEVGRLTDCATQAPPMWPSYNHTRLPPSSPLS